MDITWGDLTIAVNGKPIIRRMSGRARAGRMIAVMGPTGSGKTTLLTNLAARGEGTYDIGGEVRYGGQEWSKALKRRLGFVEQEDLVAAELTVRQNLNVAAQLRLPQHRLAPSGEEADPGWLVMNRKLERVEEVIRMLHMEKCADTVVGSAGARGVSGGEKKRLCIGMELLTEPKFLFFDEPTSGLDSSHALLVAKCMRDLCRSGVTVISSIHQPSSQIFELFDDLLLLDEGNVAYFGPTADSVSFFSSVGFDCPTSWNPADFFMDLLVLEEKQAALREKLGYVASRPGKQHAQANADAAAAAARNVMSVTVELASSGSVSVRLSAGRARVRDAKAAMWSAAGFAPVQIVLCDSAEGHTPLDDGELLEDGQTLWLDDVKFSAARLCADQHKEGDGPAGLLPATVSNAVADRYTAPFSMQLRVLTERIFVVQAEQQWSWMNFSLYTLLASSTGMCWWRTGYEEKHIFTRMSLVFWFIGTWAFFPLFNSLMTFGADMVMLKKELAVSSYRLSAYFLARTTVMLPLDMLWTSLYCPIAYYMGQINDDPLAFLQIFAAVNLTLVTFQSISLVISAGVRTPRLFIVCILLISTLFSSGGLFIPIDELPSFIRWMRHINPLRYSNDLVMHLYLSGDQTYACKTDGASSFSKCNALNHTNLQPGDDRAAITQAEVLEHFGVEKEAWECVAFMGGLALVCRVLAYRLLRAKTNGFEGCDCTVKMPCGAKDEDEDEDETLMP